VTYQLKSSYIRLTQEKRYQKLPMAALAITGGIASGKSTFSEALRVLKHPVLNADHIIKMIYQKESARDFLSLHAPHTLLTHQHIDFTALRNWAFKDKKNIALLESYLYPQMGKVITEELNKLPIQNYFFYEIPLLFEKKMEHLFDQIICISLSSELQKKRLQIRDQQSDSSTLEKIIQEQFPLDLKKSQSHFIIDNTGDLQLLHQEAQKITQQLFNLV
jgi:dephospho-CoA kinase